MLFLVSTKGGDTGRVAAWMERDFLPRPVVRGQGVKFLNYMRYIQVRYKEEILYYEGDESLEQVAQRSCGCPFAGSVQGQVG